MRKVSSEWRPEDWEIMATKLRKLSLKELGQLTTQVGIEFVAGNDSVTDEEEFISVLDEAGKEELLVAYERAVLQRKADENMKGK